MRAVIFSAAGCTSSRLQTWAGLWLLQDHPAPVWMVLPILNVATLGVSTALPQQGQLGSGPNLRPFLLALGHLLWFSLDHPPCHLPS